MGDNFLTYMYEVLGMRLTIALIVLLFLIFLLALFSIIQAIFRKKGGSKENTKKGTQKISLNTSSAKSPRHELILLDKKVKSFFKTKLNSESELTYSEIIKKLKEKNKPLPISFCKEMNYHLYSEKTTSKQEVADMKRKFLDVTQSKKEKTKIKKIKKKQQDKKSKLKKVNKLISSKNKKK